MFSSKDIFFGSQASGYRISNSLRFRGSASASLSRTPASATNRQTYTWSGWIKRGLLGSTRYTLFSSSNGGANNFTAFSFDSDNIRMLSYNGGVKVLDRTSTPIYRDPSAFYHIVIAVDMTQTTATNRQRLYVNGVEVTAWTNTTTLAQNSDTWINYNQSHFIAKDNDVTTYFDGYMAEVNFLDGYPTVSGTTYNATTWAALNVATLFGAYDTNGIWQPSRYAGTYSGNSFYLPFSPSTTSTYAGSFNGSSQLLSIPDNAVFTMGSGDFTIEAWVNFSASGRQIVVYQGDAGGTDSTISFYLERSSLNYLRIYVVSGVTGYFATGTTVIPNNQWVHIAGVRNGNNLVCYLDGQQQATASVTGVTINDSTYPVQISGYGNGAATGLIVNGSISNVRIVKGTAVYTSNFTPPTAALTAISGTSLLCLQSSSPTQDNSGNSLTITNVGTVTTSTATPFVANVTSDASGLNNGWIPSNINASTPGSTYDSMIDSPTNYADGGNGRGNYCTLNPIYIQSGNTSTTYGSMATLSDGNLSSVMAAGTNVYGTISPYSNSGKWYAECTASAVTTDLWIGMMSGDGNINRASYISKTSGVVVDNVSKSTAGFSAGNTIGIAIDTTAQTIQFYVNNSPVGSAYTWTGGWSYNEQFFCYTNAGATVYWNFGQRGFLYTPPSGYSAVNTQNLSTPTITNGAPYMAAVTYTGNGNANGDTQSIVASTTNSGNNPLGLTFQPDFVWTKDRTTAGTTSYDYYLMDDSVRGAGIDVNSNTTAAEYSGNQISAFGATGFTARRNTAYNQNNVNGITYVAWEWAAGGAPTTNNVAGAGNVPTSGSVIINGSSSTSALAGTLAATRISANTNVGFSIVTYTGNGTLGATVAHGLSAAPSMIMFKNRTSAIDWAVYHISIGNTTAVSLNSALPTYSPSTAYFNNTSPNATVFTIGNGTTVNTSTNNYVAYCWTPIAGFSAFGSYVGNGSATFDGPFIYTGFRPRYLLIKSSTQNPSNWVVLDTSRNTYNVANNYLMPSDPAVEAQFNIADILSNGFKIKAPTGTITNNLNDTYLYAAFAENPFKIARAR